MNAPTLRLQGANGLFEMRKSESTVSATEISREVQFTFYHRSVVGANIGVYCNDDVTGTGSQVLLVPLWHACCMTHAIGMAIGFLVLLAMQV